MCQKMQTVKVPSECDFELFSLEESFISVI